MRRGSHLMVVDSAPPACEATPERRIFDHWVWMLNKPANRTAFGPTRQRAVAKMLALYDEQTLLLAIEGCAASAWHAGNNDRGRPFTDLELILRDEAHVERFAEDGEALRQRAARDAARRRAAAAAPAPAEPDDPAAAQAAREHLRQMAARMAGRSHG